MLQVKIKGVREILFENIIEPIPKKDEALINIKSIGICGSDVNIFLGNSSFLKFPQVHGHEFGGVIESINNVFVKNNKIKLAIGNKVVVNPVIYCGACYYCKSGLEYLCDNKSVIGDENNEGAMKEKITVPIRNIIPLNDNFDIIQAPMIEPTAVALHAIESYKNFNILIIGLGTIGLLVQEIAKLNNNNIITMDIKKEFIKLSEYLGSNIALNFNDKDKSKKIKSYLGENKIDVVIDTVTSRDTIDFAIDIVKKHGEVKFIGIPHKNFILDFIKVLIKDLKIMPSFLYTPTEFKEATNLIENNLVNIKCLISKIFKLKEAKEAYEYKINNPVVKVLITNQ